MASFLVKGRSVVDYGRDVQFSVLGWHMSRNGIRSLVIVVLAMMIIWPAVIIKILHVAGVFDG